MNSPRGDSPATAHTGRGQLLSGLLARVAAGDREAFAALYDETAATVHGVAQRVLRDPDLAADVTQEVMIEAWRQAARFDSDRGAVLAWLSTMARRRAIDRVRAEQSNRDRLEGAAAREYQRPYDEVAEEVTGNEDAVAVRRCLARLSELQRDALFDAFYGGLTYREVAEHTSTALPTIKSRIRDGLRGLRRCLTAARGSCPSIPQAPDDQEVRR